MAKGGHGAPSLLGIDCGTVLYWLLVSRPATMLCRLLQLRHLPWLDIGRRCVERNIAVATCAHCCVSASTAFVSKHRLAAQVLSLFPYLYWVTHSTVRTMASPSRGTPNQHTSSRKTHKAYMLIWGARGTRPPR